MQPKPLDENSIAAWMRQHETDPTARLLEIWEANDRRAHFDEEFEAIWRILFNRNVPIPPQSSATPSKPPASETGVFDSDGFADFRLDISRPEGPNHSLFALEVQGDSMIDANINDGDIVILKQATVASNGEMVAVWLEDQHETLLKYFYCEGGQVRLESANRSQEPILIEDLSRLRIIGRVVSVIRNVPGIG